MRNEPHGASTLNAALLVARATLTLEQVKAGLRIRRSARRQPSLPGCGQAVAKHLPERYSEAVGEVVEQEQPGAHPALLHLGDEVARHPGPHGQRLLAQAPPRPELPQSLPERDQSLPVDL